MPNDLKAARVVFVFKKSAKTETGNHRPVSLLTVISKVLERVFYDQFEGFLLPNKSPFRYQAGLRRGFPTDTCLTHLSDYMRFQMIKSNLQGMVLLDLQKGFNTIDHDILVMKLETIGLLMGCVTLLWHSLSLPYNHF